jgi:hypothetical protein
VRYKLPAETSWQTALYPTGRSQSGQSVSYRAFFTGGDDR